MSLSRLWLTLAILLPVLGSLVATMSTVDLAYHLRAGAEMLATGGLLTVDTWTFTAAGQPWVNQQWGSQLIFRGVELVGGWTGLAVFRAVLVGTIFGLVLLVARRRGLDARSAALLTLSAFVVAVPALALRPQLLGLLSFALVLLLVTERRSHPRRLWLVPIVVAVWANLHGSFFLGPVVLGLAWLEDIGEGVDRPHRTLAVAVVSAIAACVTPFGAWVWAYAVGLSVDPNVTARISEWRPTSLHDASGVVFFASALAVVALIARRGRSSSWPTLAWLGVFFLIGVYAQRGIVWWPLATVAIVAGTLVPARPDAARVETTPMRRLNVGVAGLLVLAIIASFPGWRPIEDGTAAPAGMLNHAPPAITDYLRGNVQPGDRILNPQVWGSWFEYVFRDALVAIDSRIELFPPETWDDYEAVMDGVDGWDRQVEAWQVTWVVLDGSSTGERERFERAGWRVVHVDDDGLVLALP